MRVLVCGGRDYRNSHLIFKVLDKLHADTPITLLIEGDARGADRIAGRWAEERGVPLKSVPANWEDLTHPEARIKIDKNGRSYDANAGGRRNKKMLDEHEPHLVVQFPGGFGTRDMVSRARKRGVPVKVIEDATFKGKAS